MSDSVLIGILAIPIAIAGALVALESGLVRRNERTSDKPSDDPTENQNLDRWGAIILWVLGGLGAVALVFFVWFLLVLWAASR
jgi:hypothetical protein